MTTKGNNTGLPLKMTLTSKELSSMTEEDFTGDHGFWRYSRIIRGAVENRRQVVAEASTLCCYDEAAEKLQEARRAEFSRSIDEVLGKLESCLVEYPNLEVRIDHLGSTRAR